MIHRHTTRVLRSGQHMPLLGLGTWELHNPASAIEQGLKLGYTMIDTSGNYGTQPGIAAGIAASGLDRSQLFIVTKIENDEDSYAAMQENLKELNMDHVELALIHWPPEHDSGQKLWQGLIRAQQDGLAKDIGVSNYNERQIEDLIRDSGEVPAVNQIEWSPFAFNQDMLDFADDNHMVIQAYSPLTRANRLDDQQLTEIADSYDKSPTQLLIRWNLQLGVVPIIKASSAKHQAENLMVFDFDISDTDMETLNSMSEAYSALR
jgi:diketogulonate reductase-like aldo/keto reductase